jgi:SAM-dependent methyltransferase
MLGTPATPHPIKIVAHEDIVTLELPNVIDARISTVTYTFQTHLKAMGINPAEFREKFSGKDVLLVGEGFGALLPALVRVGAHVKALDPLYALADVNEESWNKSTLSKRPLARKTINEIRKYLRTYKEYLVPGISSNLPLSSGSFDYVISSMLINNFRPESNTPFHVERAKNLIRLTVLESVRVLKQDGRAFHIISLKHGHDFFEQMIAPADLSALRPEMEVQTKLTGPLPVVVEFQDTNGGHKSLEAGVKLMWTITAQHK